MNCREVKEKLNKLADNLLAIDEEQALHEHLNRCPDCARLVLAEQLLMDDIERIRSTQPLRSMTAEQVREAIAIREKHYKKTRLGARIMRHVNNTIYTRPRLSLAMAAACALLFASVLVPVKAGRPIGYQVAFAAPNHHLVLNRDGAEKMLAALELDDAHIAISKADSEAEYIIAPLKDTAQINRLTAALDSLGCKRIRSTAALGKSEDRTIWQLLFDDNGRETDGPSAESYGRESGLTTPTDFKEEFNGDFILWLPGDGQHGDNLSGILMQRHAEKTNMWLLGEEASLAPNVCGWHQYLNNSVMNTETPDGEQATFRLYEIEDVRMLEKMGYNFATMEWDTPGKIPIPGMGPKLNEVTLDHLGNSAVIEFMVPQAYEVQLRILDRRGREIRNLLDCMPLAGIYHVTWNGLDDDGDRVKPGRYTCRFIAGDFEETQDVEFKHY